MADSTLTAIRKKVRRLTRSPSTQQLSTADIDEYINTFIQYDFPQELRLFSFRKTLTFYTAPNIDVYETSSTVGDPLFNFKNIFSAVLEPMYVAGYQAKVSQSEAEFYAMYPFTNTVVTETTGDGATVLFTGTLSAVPVIRNRVVFTSVDTAGNSLVMTDDGSGAFEGDGVGTIDYESGAYSITFTAAPGASENIQSLTVTYTAARPDTIFYFDNKFTVRPIPDQAYPIQVEVDQRPTEVLLSTDKPDLEQFWQLIAYGSAIKIFQDRNELESAQELMPEFKHQELLVLRRTIVQQSKERAGTIYTDGTWIGYGNSFGSGQGR